MAGLLSNKYRDHEPVWHVQAAMLGAIVLQLLLPDTFVIGSRLLLVFAEVLLLGALSYTTPKQQIFESLSRRINALALLAIAGIANTYALFTVVNNLLSSGRVNNGRQLIVAAINIYLTNIIIFGLCYWEMDGGGPGRRVKIPKHDQDFLFPQNQNEDYKHRHWQPTFADYLYVSSTNAMAFSPTDTMPLSRRAKFLMLAQATLSIITVALVAARAVNILN